MVLAGALTASLGAPAWAQEQRSTAERMADRRAGERRATPILESLRVPETAIPDGSECEPQPILAASPKLAFLNYFWHRPEEFQCTMLVPSEGPIDSDDYGPNGYYHRRFQRLKRYGVDVLGFVLTGFDRPDFNVEGQVVGTWRHGRSLRNSILLAEDAELPFFIYYDLNVRTAIKQRVCKTPAPPERFSCPNPEHRPISEYDLRKADFYHQIRKDLLRIKDELILPHLDSYYMLEDVRGNPVVDEAGLPRPVIGIYIARDIVPNNRINRLVNFVTNKYRQDGLGTPAFILDTIFWNDPLHAKVVKRFGDSAVAVTSFFPVNHVIANQRGIQRMLEWVPHLSDLYTAAAAAIAEEPALHELQVWPGIATMFDNRKVRTARCTGFQDPVTPQMKWHLHGKEDWRALLRTAYESTYQIDRRCAGHGDSDQPPVQSLVINYENEFRESAVTDCVRKTKDGRVAYPFHFACELMKVVAEEDRWK